MLVKIEVRKSRGQWDEMVGWHHWLNGHEFEQTLVNDRDAWNSAIHGIAKCQMWLSDWTKINSLKLTGRYGISSLRNLPLVPSHLIGKRLIYPCFTWRDNRLPHIHWHSFLIGVLRGPSTFCLASLWFLMSPANSKHPGENICGNFVCRHYWYYPLSAQSKQIKNIPARTFPLRRAGIYFCIQCHNFTSTA